MCRNTANINFHYKTNSIKINDKFVNKFKKILTLAYFWFIFLILGAKHFFSKTRLGHAHLNMDFQEHANLEKTNETIPRKCLGRRTDGKTDGQTDPISQGRNVKCGRNWFGKSENIIATINSCICCIPCYIKSSGIIRELATVPCKDKKPIDICILWRDSAIRDRSYLQN